MKGKGELTEKWKSLFDASVWISVYHLLPRLFIISDVHNLTNDACSILCFICYEDYQQWLFLIFIFYMEETFLFSKQLVSDLFSWVIHVIRLC